MASSHADIVSGSTDAVVQSVGDSLSLSVNCDHPEKCPEQHEHSSHSCHFGHCNCVLSLSKVAIGPALMRALTYNYDFNYIDVSLSGLRRPPKA